MADPREALAEIKALADAATPGPWVPVLDHPDLNSQFVWLQSSTDADGQPNQWGGVAETGWAWPMIASSDLSDGQGWAGGVEQDARTARFIAAARSDVPRLVAALTAVLDLHVPTQVADDPTEGHWCNADADDHPCPTVQAITGTLSDD